ncbi:MAG: dimethylsulfoniopropionate demethylase [Kiloniellales bacterium]|nr:dimethylsulfoniopropionate demethylase [Kiloniellales bacterium]
MTTARIGISRRLRSTPFSRKVEEAGVSAYTVYNHTLLATAFRSPEEDYRHLCRNVQLWDVSCEKQVELRGPDAARLMQMMTPRDMDRAVIGQCVYAPLVDEAGGMVNDPVALKLAEDHFWISIADSDVLLWAKGLAYGLKLEVEVSEPGVYPLAVQGPKADTLMARVFGDAVKDIRFFRFQELPFDGHPLVVARSGWSKQGGFEIYLDDAALAEPLWDRLWQAGQDLEVGPGCPNLIERIEGGLLSYGNDMSREHNPFECGLQRYCNREAPDFIAKDALDMIRETGIARQIRGLRFDGEPAPALRETWTLFAEERFAGLVSSAVWSPRFRQNLAFAMVERDFWEPGTAVQVELPGGSRRQARVELLPFAAPDA